jgi:hypothetical protein
MGCLGTSGFRRRNYLTCFEGPTQLRATISDYFGTRLRS